VLGAARAALSARGLEHATIQVEPPDGMSECSSSW
jgi:cobalt-zinc-cadmium efflux system protein